MGVRRVARERALQALYQLEVGSGTPSDALEVAWSADRLEAGLAEIGSPPSAAANVPVSKSGEADGRQFAWDLVQGVRKHQDELDALIQEHSHHWRLDRMSRIDRNVLRMGVYELKFRHDIPLKVSINEAVELGKRFGSEESSAFINGLLDRIGALVRKEG